MKKRPVKILQMPVRTEQGELEQIEERIEDDGVSVYNGFVDTVESIEGLSAAGVQYGVQIIVEETIRRDGRFLYQILSAMTILNYSARSAVQPAVRAAHHRDAGTSPKQWRVERRTRNTQP